VYPRDGSVLSRNRIALKEWASVCGRLGRGEIVAVLRKGGILERRDGFQAEHREFFLFPTRFHEEGAGPPGRVELGVYAVVEAERAVGDLDALRRLEGFHGVPWKDVERRFRYGKEPGVRVLALRAWRLERPPVVEDAGAYDGCRSWVEFPRDLEVGPARPALGDRDFADRVRALQAALDGKDLHAQG
jgi:hypothetical protein